MIVDVLGGSRALYQTLRAIGYDELPRMLVTDCKPRAVYLNARLAEGSKLGDACFLIACVVEDDVVIGNHAKIFGSAVGNKVSIGTNALVELTSFEDNVSIGDSALVGKECRFGAGVKIGSASRYKAQNKFGDNLTILHRNRFGEDCEFGKGAQIGTSNLFYGCPKFASTPTLNEGPNPMDKSLRVYQQGVPDRTGNKGRTVITLAEYLESKQFEFARTL